VAFSPLLFSKFEFESSLVWEFQLIRIGSDRIGLRLPLVASERMSWYKRYRRIYEGPIKIGRYKHLCKLNDYNTNFSSFWTYFDRVFLKMPLVTTTIYSKNHSQPLKWLCRLWSPSLILIFLQQQLHGVAYTILFVVSSLYLVIYSLISV